MSELPAGVVLEDVACPLGCSRRDRLVLRGTDRLNHVPGTFDLVECRECGLLRTNPRPTLRSIGAYYPDTYHAFADGIGHGGSNGHPAPARLPGWLRELLDTEAFAVPDVRPGRVLEVGCASGAFLASMIEKGWQGQGIEPAPGPAARAASRGIPVHCGQLETAPDPSSHFDLIVGWMVVEHLHQPIASLEKLRTWTKPGGWLAFSVPNAASLERRLFGDRWYALQLPGHLYHYTPDTIGRVLEKAGWQVERIVHHRVLTNLLGSVGHVLEDRRTLPAMAGRLTGPWARRRPVRLALSPLALALAAAGQTGRMTVWARPR